MKTRLLSSKRGQSAMEYVTTYGWAILIVLIIGIVIWQLGIFDIGGRLGDGFTGFSVVVPQEWKMADGGSFCLLSVTFLNGAGESIKNITTVGGDPCIPASAPAGAFSTCSKTTQACGGSGSAYSEDIAVYYERSLDNESFQTAGEVWGSVE